MTQDKAELGGYWSGAKGVEWSEYDGLRPAYPALLYERILSYHKGQRRCALDVGTGPGTLIAFLADTFEQVIGSDLVQDQLDVATKRFAHASNVEFKLSPAENLSWLADDSVDIITCGETIHWLDSKAFIDECARVLRPGGTLAILYYHVYFTLPNNSEANECLGTLQDALLRPVVASKEDSMIRIRQNGASNLDCHRLEPRFTRELRIKWNALPDKFAEWGQGIDVPNNKSSDCQEENLVDTAFFSAQYDVDTIRQHLLSLGHTSLMLSNDASMKEQFEETFVRLRTLLGDQKTLASWSFTLLLGSLV